MKNDETIIKIKRSKYIVESREIALLTLDNTEFIYGVQYMINYKDGNKIDTIFALGIRNGKGRDCYRIVSIGQDNLVWDVTEELPDISELIHGEIYLYHELSTGVWYLVYSEDGEKKLTQISDTPQTYRNIKDNSVWITTIQRTARRLENTYSREEIDQKVQEAAETIKYISFDDLTPEQIEELRGQKGDQGPKGDAFTYEDFTKEQLEGLRGPRGFNGSVLNFIVLTEEEYNNISPIDLDPEKFYYIYEDSQPTPGEFYAYVEDDTLYVSANFIDPDIMSINPGNTSISDDILTLIQGGSTLIVATPLLERYGGTYTEPFILTITCPTEGALIRYTTDGSEPTGTSEIYDSTTGLLISRTMTLKVIATKVGYESSGVVIANYTISEPEPGKVDIPEFLQPEGEYINRVTTAIHTSTEGATIYYTLNGTEPTKNSLEYSPGTLLTFESTTTLKARAFKESMNPSDIATATYVIRESQGISVDGDTLNDDTGSYDSLKWIINTTATVNDDILEFI